MNLMSISFIGIYFPLLLICYYNPFFKNNTFRKILLLTASLGMYSFGEPIYLFLLIGVILLNYGLVKLSDKFQTKILRTVAIILDALLLLFFKYINSLLDFAVFNPEISRIAFPIGLSYFIFKAISFVVDSSEETGGNILDVSIHISNFLTIISGPLSTYKQELPEITTKKKKQISARHITDF